MSAILQEIWIDPTDERKIGDTVVAIHRGYWGVYTISSIYKEPRHVRLFDERNRIPQYTEMGYKVAGLKLQGDLIRRKN